MSRKTCYDLHYDITSWAIVLSVVFFATVLFSFFLAIEITEKNSGWFTWFSLGIFIVGVFLHWYAIERIREYSSILLQRIKDMDPDVDL
jgi:hypothetical protein